MTVFLILLALSNLATIALVWYVFKSLEHAHRRIDVLSDDYVPRKRPNSGVKVDNTDPAEYPPSHED